MESKVCKQCGIEKSLSEFGKNHTSRDRYNGKCKLCKREMRKTLAIERGYWEDPIKHKQSQQNWRDNNREQYRAQKRDWDSEHRQQNNSRYKILARQLRHEVLMAYGGYKCNCPGCDITTYEFLCIDHIDGGGNKHRKELGKAKIYPWLKKNNFPSGFQVLCHNCNLAKGFYGKCPHVI